jgi:DNA-binding LytR/AlgR family response regulator
MSDKTRILIVEDDMIIASNLSLQLSKLGYEVCGIETRGEEAIQHARENIPDIILMDIRLRGAIDGVETARKIRQRRPIPIIFLTANTDDATFSRAKETQPYAFISKPFNKINLQRTIALVEESMKDEVTDVNTDQTVAEVLDDRIFLRQRGMMVKLMFEDLLFLEAQRNYCQVLTINKSYLVVSTLKQLEDKLPYTVFIRVHRSFLVNLSKIDALGDKHLEMKGKVIPVSKTYKELLMKRIKTL